VVFWAVMRDTRNVTGRPHKFRTDMGFDLAEDWWSARNGITERRWGWAPLWG